MAVCRDSRGRFAKCGGGRKRVSRKRTRSRRCKYGIVKGTGRCLKRPRRRRRRR